MLSQLDKSHNIIDKRFLMRQANINNSNLLAASRGTQRKLTYQEPIESSTLPSHHQYTHQYQQQQQQQFDNHDFNSNSRNLSESRKLKDEQRDSFNYDMNTKSLHDNANRVSQQYQQIDIQQHRHQHHEQQQSQHHAEKQQQQIEKRPRALDKSYLIKLKEKRQRSRKITTTANVSGTKFEIVKLAIEAMGIKLTREDNFDCNLIWDDTRISIEAISELRSFQRYNHFPAMSEISRKDALARNIMKLSKLLPYEYNFVPQTWILPNDFLYLCAYAAEMKKTHQKKTYILKPANAACGHGIKLYRSVEKIQPTDNYIVQEYIANPFLLDGFKFDLRIYVLVTSCDPLRAFIFNDGLVRLGTEQYEEPSESNLDHLFMHLTNYSVNKHNTDKYDEGDRTGQNGTKRSLRHFFEYLKRQDKDVTKLWREIQEIALKTLLVAEPYLFHTYKMCRPGQTQYSESVCFEILGFDILLDENLKPWLLEVNRSPSFGSDHQVDFDVKSRLLLDSFNLIRFRSSDRRRSLANEKAEAQRRLYKSEVYSSKNELLNSLQINTNCDKNTKMKQKKLFDMIEQLKLLRRAKQREDYENVNLGNFSRLFPVDDKARMENYLNTLSHAFNLFYPVGKQNLWKKTYERIQEDELIDKIFEFDNDNNCMLTKNLYLDDANDIYKFLNDNDSESESEYSNYDMNSDSDREMSRDRRDYRSNDINMQHSNNKILQLNDKIKITQVNRDVKTPSALSTGRTSDSTSGSSLGDQANKKALYNDQKRLKKDVDNKENQTDSLKRAINLRRKSKLTESILEKQPKNEAKIRRNGSQDAKITRHNNTLRIDRSASVDRHTPTLYDKAMASIRMTHNLELKREKNESKIDDINKMKSTSLNFNKDAISGNLEYEEIYNEKLTIAVYKMLSQLEIKFPGRSSTQAKTFLSEVYSKFDDFKQSIGNYWMVKLDDAKRTKIVDIVKSNLLVILKKAYMSEILDNLRLYKIFMKLLNRMLWMHGQGLWNCFITTNQSSWETIFSKSSFIITENELKCCHRLIELCKDCVLIVYQYALEQKHTAQHGGGTSLKSSKSFSSKSTSFLLSKEDTSALLKRKQFKK